MSEVSIAKVRKSFGSVDVIRDIDLKVSDGEFLVLVGPSGCGKSTLLRMIAGLEVQTSGSISIGGRVVDDVTPRERNIAMVFQSYALYPHMTVAQNMGFSLRLAGLPKAKIQAAVQEAARMMHLEDYMDRRPSQLSGGQRQRVAMGRAVVRNPDVFLFDEPLSNLDAKLRVQMRAEIKALHQKVGQTSIYVTHDQVEAMTLADRIVVMNKGHIEQEGSPLELYRKPRNTFVAGFIGSPNMNFVEGRLRGSLVELDDGSTINLGTRYAAPDEALVTLGLRPEHLRVSANGQITGHASVVEPMGAQTIVSFTHGTGSLLALVDGETVVKVGDAFGVDIEPEHLHLFARESGERLERVS